MLKELTRKKVAEIKSETVTITPSVAQAWLSMNANNRKRQPRFVRQYARDMKDGGWRLTGDSIKFDVNNRLIDGLEVWHPRLRGRPNSCVSREDFAYLRGVYRRRTAAPSDVVDAEVLLELVRSGQDRNSPALAYRRRPDHRTQSQGSLMNRDRLYRLADKLDGSGPYLEAGPIPADKWEWDQWFRWSVAGDNVDPSLPSFAADPIGWACTDPWFQRRGLVATKMGPKVVPTYAQHYGFTAVQLFFGLSPDDADHLFWPGEYEGITVTPEIVARRILMFAARSIRVEAP